MPIVQANGVRLCYENHGSAGEPVVFAHGLLFSRHMFEAQVEALSESHRCVAFDFRAHGDSEVTVRGLDMDTLASDAAALLEALDCRPCHFVGQSMGGFIGLRLAARRPELIKSLTLLNSSAEIEPRRWRLRALNLYARCFGLKAVARLVRPLMLDRRRMTDEKSARRIRQWRERLLENDCRAITRAVSLCLQRGAVTAELPRISAPTLIVAGEADRVLPPACSRRLHEGIRGSRLVMLPGVGHLSPIEAPDLVTETIRDFLASLA